MSCPAPGQPERSPRQALRASGARARDVSGAPAFRDALLAHATLELFEPPRRVRLAIRAAARAGQAIDLLSYRAICVTAQIRLDLVHGGVHRRRTSAPIGSGRNATGGGAQLSHHLSHVPLGERQLAL